MALVDLSTKKIKNPILIGQNMWTSSVFGSGCSVIEVKFSRPQKVATITFRNHYTAYIQVLVLCRMVCNSIKQKYVKQSYSWVVGIYKMDLMPHPHYETGGRDYFSVFQPSNNYVTGIRLILKQPSPKWKQFFINQLSIFQETFPFCKISQPIHNGQLLSESKQREALIMLIKKQTWDSLRKNNKEKDVEDGMRSKSELLSIQKNISRMRCEEAYEFDLLPEIKL